MRDSITKFLEELREKSEDEKKKILIGVALILILILGFWWLQNTKKHLREVKQEGIDIELPAPNN